jgi:hypothetical protein
MNTQKENAAGVNPAIAESEPGSTRITILDENGTVVNTTTIAEFLADNPAIDGLSAAEIATKINEAGIYRLDMGAGGTFALVSAKEEVLS